MTKELFKLIRHYLDMSQHEFGDYIGLNPSTIAMIERGYRPITKNTESKVARVFDPNDKGFLEYKSRIDALSC